MYEHKLFQSFTEKEECYNVGFHYLKFIILISLKSQ